MWRSLIGMIRIEITSADVSEMLTMVAKQGIQLFDIEYCSDLTLTCSVQRNEYQRLLTILKRRGDTSKIIMKFGYYWLLHSFRLRPVLIVSLILLTSLILFLPTRVLFVEVKGNRSISTNLIVENAEICGISFGASRRAVRSEKIKNSLLSLIPDLQWVGVNTNGCTAIISVVEKTKREDKTDLRGVSNIVASRDGVISHQTVLKGNALCKVGDAVNEGQLLVSGYTDSGLSIKASNADAEIFAQTVRDISLIIPLKMDVRQEENDTTTKYSLIIGKKLIKLSLGSGISDASCAKIYKKHVLTLPGGFQLPFTLLEERILNYQYVDKNLAVRIEPTNPRAYADDYLLNQMVAGRILSADIITETDENLLKLTGRYACVEMIGKIQKEELTDYNG